MSIEVIIPIASTIATRISLFRYGLKSLINSFIFSLSYCKIGHTPRENSVGKVPEKQKNPEAHLASAGIIGQGSIILLSPRRQVRLSRCFVRKLSLYLPPFFNIYHLIVAQKNTDVNMPFGIFILHLVL